jgi:hypothetical protein
MQNVVHVVPIDSSRQNLEHTAPIVSEQARTNSVCMLHLTVPITTTTGSISAAERHNDIISVVKGKQQQAHDLQHHTWHQPLLLQ